MVDGEKPGVDLQRRGEAYCTGRNDLLPNGPVHSSARAIAVFKEATKKHQRRKNWRRE